MARPRRVLLGQLGANGDCVYATTVARQIKADDPSCHLTWAIGSSCRQVIAFNPHVDEVWTVPQTRREDMAAVWNAFETEARERQARGDFDAVYFTQIFPNNFKNYDGTIRASIFRGYPGRITVPVTPVIRLSDEEIDRVGRFAEANGLSKARPVVLLETAPTSGQSPMNPRWANELARVVVTMMPDALVIMNSGIEDNADRRSIVDASELGFREIAALAGYCNLFVGCSSGITWLLTSDAVKPMPTIQVLSANVGEYGAVVHDLEAWGLASDHVIELHDCAVEHAARCIVATLVEGVSAARARYHEELPLRFDLYVDMIFPMLRSGDAIGFATSLAHTVKRYGPRFELARDLAVRFLPHAPRRWVRTAIDSRRR